MLDRGAGRDVDRAVRGVEDCAGLHDGARSEKDVGRGDEAGAVADVRALSRAEPAEGVEIVGDPLGQVGDDIPQARHQRRRDLLGRHARGRLERVGVQ